MSRRAAAARGLLLHAAIVFFALASTRPVASQGLDSTEVGLSRVTDSAPKGDLVTAHRFVTLEGRTEPRASLQILDAHIFTMADDNGAFSFADVELPVGETTLTVRANNDAEMFDVPITIRVIEPEEDGDVVLDWNAETRDIIKFAGVDGPNASRLLAMVHTAMFDAINGTRPAYVEYVVGPAAPSGASAQAAGAAAAHRVLSSILRDHVDVFDGALNLSLATLPQDQTLLDGRAWGEAVGSQILDLRTGDGSDAPSDYRPSSDPGHWAPTPPNFEDALLPAWGNVVPFGIAGVGQFSLNAPPALRDQQYADDFNEVRVLGRIDSEDRTPDQTEVAQFWADGRGTATNVGHWNAIAHGVALSSGTSLQVNARLFALLNVAVADAVIVSWNVKYVIDLWRPHDAIMRADEDDNEDTEADREWAGLVENPPHPAYVSDAGAVATAASTVLTAFFGPSLPFESSSDNFDGQFGIPDVTRSFASFVAAADEAGEASILGGTNFRFCETEARRVAAPVAAFILAGYLRPLNGPTSATLELSRPSDSAPDGDGITAFDTVTLLGKADPNATIYAHTLDVQLSADANGDFTLAGVPLALGENSLVLQTSDKFGEFAISLHQFLRIDVAVLGDPVSAWTAEALDAIRSGRTNEVHASRNLAMMATAAFDAVNGTVNRFRPYATAPAAPTGASAEAAAIAAAHSVLASAYLEEIDSLDAMRDLLLLQVPDGTSKTDGVDWGLNCAATILALRESDGSADEVEYRPGDSPGEWRPTPPDFFDAENPNWPLVLPWTLARADQFRPEPPTDLTSEAYTADYVEVAAFGAIDSPDRTPDQTDAALFWANVPGTATVLGQWNRIADATAVEQQLSFVERARLSALLNLALADAAIIAFDAKYTYNFWRPQAAILEAETDGNDDTRPDERWESLLASPPFPEYVAARSTYSGAAAGILDAVIGDRVGFSDTSELLPESFGVSPIERSFESFQQAAAEASESTIWGGINFRTSGQTGLLMGQSLSQHILQNFLTERSNTGALVY